MSLSESFSSEALRDFFRIDDFRRKVLDNNNEKSGEYVENNIKTEAMGEDWLQEKQTLLKSIETLESHSAVREEDFNKTIEEMFQEKEAHLKTIETLENDKRCLEEQFAKQRAETDAKIQSLEKQLSALNASQADADHKRFTLQKRIEFLTVEKEELRRDWIKKETELDSRNKALMKQLSEKANIINESKSDMDSKCREVSSLREYIDSLRSEKVQSNKDINALKKRLDEVEKKLQEANNFQDLLMKKDKEYCVKIKELKEEIDDLKSCKVEADKDSNAWKNRLDEISAQKSLIEKKLKEANKYSGFQKSEIESLSKKLRIQDDKVVELTQEKTKLSQEIIYLKSSLEKENDERKKESLADKEKIKELTQASNLATKKELDVQLEIYKSHAEEINNLKNDHSSAIDKLKNDHYLELVQKNVEMAKLQKKLSVASQNHRETIASEANYRAKYIALRDEVNASPERNVVEEREEFSPRKLGHSYDNRSLRRERETRGESSNVDKREEPSYVTALPYCSSRGRVGKKRRLSWGYEFKTYGEVENNNHERSEK